MSFPKCSHSASSNKSNECLSSRLSIAFRLFNSDCNMCKFEFHRVALAFCQLVFQPDPSESLCCDCKKCKVRPHIPFVFLSCVHTEAYFFAWHFNAIPKPETHTHLLRPSITEEQSAHLGQKHDFRTKARLWDKTIPS